ncbi:MAG: hypothetical protein R3C49_07925 [Planctomycetaceae bacterium]
MAEKVRTAVAEAARAGGQVSMVGRVGDDAFAERLRQGLNRKALPARMCRPLSVSPAGWR